MLLEWFVKNVINQFGFFVKTYSKEVKIFADKGRSEVRMAKAEVATQKIIFDISDEQITKVRVEVKLFGDIPFGMKSVYEKTFPARISVLEIMQNEFKNYLEW